MKKIQTMVKDLTETKIKQATKHLWKTFFPDAIDEYEARKANEAMENEQAREAAMRNLEEIKGLKSYLGGKVTMMYDHMDSQFAVLNDYTNYVAYVTLALLACVCCLCPYACCLRRREYAANKRLAMIEQKKPATSDQLLGENAVNGESENSTRESTVSNF